MPKTLSPEIWQLVQSLSKAECALFKIRSGRQTVYTSLFDQLRSIKTWNKENISASLGQLENKDYNNFFTLRKKLLLFLLDHQRSKPEYSAEGIQILIRRSPGKYCLPRLKQAIERANEEEDYSKGLELCRLALEEFPESLITPDNLSFFEQSEAGFLGMTAGISQEASTFRQARQWFREFHPRSMQARKSFDTTEASLLSPFSMRFKEVVYRLLSKRMLAIQMRDIAKVWEHGDRALQVIRGNPALFTQVGMQSTYLELAASHCALSREEALQDYPDEELALLVRILRGKAGTGELRSWQGKEGGYTQAICYLLTKLAFGEGDFQRAKTLLAWESQRKYLPGDEEVKEELDLLRSLTDLALGDAGHIKARNLRIMARFRRKGIMEGSYHSILKALNFLVSKPEDEQSEAFFYSRLSLDALQAARPPLPFRGMWLLPALQIVPAIRVALA